MCCGNSILQKGLPFFYLHKIFYTLHSLFLLNIILSTFILLQSFPHSKRKAQNTQRSVFICINYIKVLYLNYQIKRT
ncbi:hypothetical protein CQR42_13865 [Enterococcus faecium]|nr:hypothetical protein CQR42_13865 [Enterococcus faecium]